MAIKEGVSPRSVNATAHNQLFADGRSSRSTTLSSNRVRWRSQCVEVASESLTRSLLDRNRVMLRLGFSSKKQNCRVGAARHVRSSHPTVAALLSVTLCTKSPGQMYNEAGKVQREADDKVYRCFAPTTVQQVTIYLIDLDQNANSRAAVTILRQGNAAERPSGAGRAHVSLSIPNTLTHRHVRTILCTHNSSYRVIPRS